MHIIQKYAYGLSFTTHAKRLAYVPSPSDVNKVARVYEDNTYWVVKSITPPIWEVLNDAAYDQPGYSIPVEYDIRGFLDLRGETKNYYVRPTGNDTNTGLTPQTALLTLGEALKRIPKDFINGTFYIDITGCELDERTVIPPFRSNKPVNALPPPEKRALYPGMKHEGAINIVASPTTLLDLTPNIANLGRVETPAEYRYKGAASLILDNQTRATLSIGGITSKLAAGYGYHGTEGNALRVRFVADHPEGQPSNFSIVKDNDTDWTLHFTASNPPVVGQVLMEFQNNTNGTFLAIWEGNPWYETLTPENVFDYTNFSGGVDSTFRGKKARFDFSEHTENVPYIVEANHVGSSANTARIAMVPDGSQNGMPHVYQEHPPGTSDYIIHFTPGMTKAGDVLYNLGWIDYPLVPDFDWNDIAHSAYFVGYRDYDQTLLTAEDAFPLTNLSGGQGWDEGRFQFAMLLANPRPENLGSVPEPIVPITWSTGEVLVTPEPVNAQGTELYDLSYYDSFRLCEQSATLYVGWGLGAVALTFLNSHAPITFYGIKLVGRDSLFAEMSSNLVFEGCHLDGDMSLLNSHVKLRGCSFYDWGYAEVSGGVVEIDHGYFEMMMRFGQLGGHSTVTMKATTVEGYLEMDVPAAGEVYAKGCSIYEWENGDYRLDIKGLTFFFETTSLNHVSLRLLDGAKVVGQSLGIDTDDIALDIRNGSANLDAYSSRGIHGGAGDYALGPNREIIGTFASHELPDQYTTVNLFEKGAAINMTVAPSNQPI